MLRAFEPMTVQADEGTIKEGWRDVDGQVSRYVKVNISENLDLVSLSVSDAVTIEVALDPFAALTIGEALLNAGLAIYFRPGGTFTLMADERRKARKR